jgi:hypothetical protein
VYPVTYDSVCVAESSSYSAVAWTVITGVSGLDAAVDYSDMATCTTMCVYRRLTCK